MSKSTGAKNKTKQFMDDPDNHKSFTLRQIKYRALNFKIDYEDAVDEGIYSQDEFDLMCWTLDVLMERLERYEP